MCRAADLPAFGRVLEGTYGEREGFALYGGRLDDEPAVFAEFALDGLPLEVSAQPSTSTAAWEPRRSASRARSSRPAR